MTLPSTRLTSLTALTLIVSASLLPAQSSDDRLDLDSLIITGQDAPAYTASSATTATKTDTRLLDAPQAISVVPQKLIEDRGTPDLEEILSNVAGVSVGGTYSDWDYYRIRGFDASFTTFWDGLRGDNGKNVETFGLERVEVVKGPASTLYGSGPLGGMVNIISKHPIARTFADVSITAGSHDYYQYAFDGGAVLNKEKSVYARLVAVYRDQESFVDYVNKERIYLAPSLTWEIGPDTSITFLASYTHDYDQVGFPLPAAGTVLPNPNGDIDIERYIGETSKSNQVEQWRALAGYEFKHRFNETFALRQNVSYSRLEQDWTSILYPASLSADGRTLLRYPYGYTDRLNRLGIDTALDAAFQTGSVKHNFSLGLDYYYTGSRTTSQQIDYGDFPGSYVPIDLYDPVYGQPIPAQPIIATSKMENSLVGIYFQNQSKLTDTVTLTVGGRYDFATQDNQTTSNTKEAFSPKAGITYEFIPGVSAFANYGHSFNPQWFNLDAGGQPVEPEEGDNYEIGLKYSVLQGRLSGLLSVYHLTRSNVATNDLSTANPFDSVVSGEQRSRGIEVETAAELTPGLNLTVAYAYTDAEITEDNALPIGSRLAGVPEHTFSAWLRYTVLTGPLQGLGVGLGGRYYTSQEGDVTYSSPFKLPEYGLLNAAVYYTRGRFKTQVNVDNLLNREYFTGAYNNLYVQPGEPISVKASVGWAF